MCLTAVSQSTIQKHFFKIGVGSAVLGVALIVIGILGVSGLIPGINAARGGALIGCGVLFLGLGVFLMKRKRTIRGTVSVSESVHAPQVDAAYLKEFHRFKSGNGKSLSEEQLHYLIVNCVDAQGKPIPSLCKVPAACVTNRPISDGDSLRFCLQGQRYDLKINSYACPLGVVWRTS